MNFRELGAAERELYVSNQKLFIFVTLSSVIPSLLIQEVFFSLLEEQPLAKAKIQGNLRKYHFILDNDIKKHQFLTTHVTSFAQLWAEYISPKLSGRSSLSSELIISMNYFILQEEEKAIIYLEIPEVISDGLSLKNFFLKMIHRCDQRLSKVVSDYESTPFTLNPSLEQLKFKKIKPSYALPVKENLARINNLKKNGLYGIKTHSNDRKTLINKQIIPKETLKNIKINLINKNISLNQWISAAIIVAYEKIMCKYQDINHSLVSYVDVRRMVKPSIPMHYLGHNNVQIICDFESNKTSDIWKIVNEYQASFISKTKKIVINKSILPNFISNFLFNRFSNSTLQGRYVNTSHSHIGNFLQSKFDNFSVTDIFCFSDVHVVGAEFSCISYAFEGLNLVFMSPFPLINQQLLNDFSEQVISQILEANE